MSKKKILVMVDWYLPGYKAGGPIQSVANIIGHLKNDVDFSVVTRDTDYCESTPYPGIKSDEWNTLQDGTKVFYFSKPLLSYQNIKRLLFSEKFDRVYLNSFFSYYFTIIPLLIFFFNSQLSTPKHSIILAPRGMLAVTALSIKSFKKSLYLFFFKLSGIANKIVFHASTEEEQKDIERSLGKKRVVVAPNLPKKTALSDMPFRKKEQGVARLINVARIAPEKNLLYALEILQKVRGQVQFDFYGTIYNHTYWENCKKALALLPNNIHAAYKGEIENIKIPEIMKNYHFMLMPTRGENFGHIIYESFSTGCPVIISNATPWKRLEEKKAGWDIALNDPQRMVDTIECCVAMAQEEYRQWSQCAFNYAKGIAANNDAIHANKKLFLLL